MAGSNMPIPTDRSTIRSNRVIPMTGVARTWIIAVAYVAQRNSGILNHVMPAGRRRWIVTMKFMPVKIELNPNTKAPASAGITPPIEDVLSMLYGV